MYVHTYGTASTIHGIVHAGAAPVEEIEIFDHLQFFFFGRFLCGRIFVGAV